MERVWQTSPEKEVSYKIKDVLNLFMVNGFAVSYMNLARRSYSCKSGKVDQAIISYNGDVYKCSGRDLPMNCEKEFCRIMAVSSGIT